MAQRFFTLEQGAAALGITPARLRQAAQAAGVRLTVQGGTSAVEQNDLLRIRNYLTTLTQPAAAAVTDVTLDTGYGRPPTGSYPSPREQPVEEHEDLIGPDQPPSSDSGLFSQSEIDAEAGATPGSGELPVVEAFPAEPDSSAGDTDSGPVARLSPPTPHQAAQPIPMPADSAMFTGEGEAADPGRVDAAFSEEGETIAAMPRLPSPARAGFAPAPPAPAARAPAAVGRAPSAPPAPTPVRPAAAPPPAAARAVPPAPAAAPEPAAAPNGRRVLLVESDQRAARVKKNALEREGFAVDWAPGRREMLRAAPVGNYDLILINHTAGVDDGAAALDALIAAMPDQPAAVMVPAVDQATMQAVMQRGHGGCIAKDERFLQSLPAQVFGVLERLAGPQEPADDEPPLEPVAEGDSELIELDENAPLEETDEMPEIVPEQSAAFTSMDGFIDQSAAGMFRVDNSGRLIGVNPALADLLGYPGTESFSQAVLRALLAEPRDFDALVNGLDEMPAGEGRLLDFRQADGQTIALAVYLRRLSDERGQTVGYDGVVVRPVEPAVEQPTMSVQSLRAALPPQPPAGQPTVEALAAKIESLQAALRQSATALAELKLPSSSTAAAPAQPGPARAAGHAAPPAQRTSESAEVTLAAPVKPVARKPEHSPFPPTSPFDKSSAPPPPAVESPFNTFQMSGSGIFAIPQGSSAGLIEGEPTAPENGDRAQYEIIDLNTLARQAIWFVEPKIKATGLPVDIVHRLGNCASVRGHRTQLREVIARLLMNAVQLMPGGGKIFVSSGTVSKGAFVAVTNTGPGIAADVRHRIFDDDFIPGTDWQRGLRECLDIMLRHDGKIGIISEPGRGATVTIRLPPIDDSVPAAILR